MAQHNASYGYLSAAPQAGAAETTNNDGQVDPAAVLKLLSAVKASSEWSSEHHKT
jgi:hypothetical protein